LADKRSEAVSLLMLERTSKTTKPLASPLVRRCSYHSSKKRERIEMKLANRPSSDLVFQMPKANLHISSPFIVKLKTCLLMQQ
jgi:hypothetical protein